MGELSKMRAWLLLVALAFALASAEDGVKVMEAHEVGAHSDVGEAVQPTADKGPLPKGDPTPKKVEVPATAKGTTLQERRKKRLKNEAYGLNKKYEYAKALKGKADRHLRHVMAKMSKADTAIEEAKAARLAAQQEQRAAAYVDEAKVFARVASADSGTSGGGTENLERAERRRDESNEEAKKAKAELVARQLAYGKIEAALQAARADVDKKELAFEATRDSLHEADHRYATALFNIKAGKKQKMKLEIDLAEAKSHDNDMQREQHVAHGLAHAAVLVAKNDPSGDEVQIKALLEDRDQEVMEAIGSAKDHDGISDDGKPLVAAPGTVAAEYKRRFAALPLPDSGRNPILEAEARADAGGR